MQPYPYPMKVERPFTIAMKREVGKSDKAPL